MTGGQKKDLTEALAPKGSSLQRQYSVERMLHPISSELAWRAMYKRWRGRGVNIEGLLLLANVHGWKP